MNLKNIFAAFVLLIASVSGKNPIEMTDFPVYQNYVTIEKPSTFKNIRDVASTCVVAGIATWACLGYFDKSTPGNPDFSALPVMLFTAGSLLVALIAYPMALLEKVLN